MIGIGYDDEVDPQEVLDDQAEMDFEDEQLSERPEEADYDGEVDTKLDEYSVSGLMDQLED